MKDLLLRLADKGFRPDTIIDVGAYIGDWTRLAHIVFPGSRLLMVEPQVAKNPFLDAVCRETGAEYSNLLLGARAEMHVPFHLMETGSSVFLENTDYPRTETFLSMDRLDNLPLPNTGTFFLKLDTQGYELEILKGAPEVLSRTEAVIMEGSFLEYNRGAPLIAETVAFMRARDFLCYDICQLWRRNPDNTAMQADFLFVRSNSALRR